MMIIKHKHRFISGLLMHLLLFLNISNGKMIITGLDIEIFHDSIKVWFDMDSFRCRAAVIRRRHRLR